MAEESSSVPDQAWARTLPARAAREGIVCGVFAGLIGVYAQRTVTGAEHLHALDGPAVFVANHASHADTPVLLRSLPGPYRRRTVVAAAADYFYTRRLKAAAVSLAFCTVPLQRQGAGAGADATARVGRLFADGWSLVLYPEGTRSRDGRVAPLRSGAALLAAEHGVPIVPVHLGGTHAAMPAGQSWMHRPAPGVRHRITVSIGAPIFVGAGDDRVETMEQVRVFMAACGADTTADPKLERRRAARAASVGSAA